MRRNINAMAGDRKDAPRTGKKVRSYEETLEEGSSGMKSMKRRGRPNFAKFSHKLKSGGERAYNNLSSDDKSDVRDAASRYTHTDPVRKKTLLGMHAKMRRISRSPTAPKNDF